MKIGFLTVNIGDDYIKLWKSFMRTKEIYCDINNYDFINIEESLDKTRRPHWTKIKGLQKYLKKYDWIFYSDADVNIMNFDIKLEDIINTYSNNETFFIITKDNVEVNSGNFFIKNCEKSFNFLKEVYNEYPTKRIKIGKYLINWNDQYGIYNIYRKKEYINQVKIIKQRIINAYPCICCGEKFQIGDFLIHFVNHKRPSKEHSWNKTNNITKNNITKNNITKNNITKNNITKNNITKNNITKNNILSILNNRLLNNKLLNQNNKLLNQNNRLFNYNNKLFDNYKVIDSNINRKIIVTLTSIPTRVKNSIQTILSIKNQSVKIDEIVLSLPMKSIREPTKYEDDYQLDKNNFKEAIEKLNVIIYRCSKDYGPATKLLGLLERELPKKCKEDNEPLIITIDDDKIYHPDMVKQLIDGWKRNKNNAVGRTGSNVTIINKKIHEKCYRGCDLSKDQPANILFGTGGILYRPSYFNNNIFDFKKEDKLFNEKSIFFIDDVYISLYLEYYGIKKSIIYFEKNKITDIFTSKNINSVDLNSYNRKINPLIEINKNNKYSIELFLYFKKLISKTQ